MAIVSRIKVNVLPFDCAPEALDEGIVGRAAPPVAADAAASVQQGLLKGGAGKLATLVGVKNVGSRGLAQGSSQCLQAKTGVVQ